jgi:hypothetical protein
MSMTREKWRNGRLYAYDDASGKTLMTEAHPLAPESWQFDDFYGIDTTDITSTTRKYGFYGTDPGTADTVTISVTAGVGGAAMVLSGTAHNDAVFLQTEASYYGKYDACFETRLTLSNLTECAFLVGFTDAAAIANATPMKLIAAAWTTVSVEGAMFVYDYDATDKTVHLMGVKTNVDATAVNTTILPVAATYNIFRVELEDNGTTTNAKFYIDGVLKGTLTDVLLRTTALTPIVCVGTRAATANAAAQRYALVDYMKAWERRA